MKLELDQLYKCKVIKILPIGAIVDLGDGTTELIHISQISDKFVKNCEDYLYVGQALIAKCVKGLTKPKCLSLRYINLEPVTQLEAKPKLSETVIDENDFASMLDYYADEKAIARSQYEKRASSRKKQRG